MTVRARRWWRLAALPCLAAAAGGWTHPIHTTLAEVGYDPRTQVVTVALRVFADDFGTAVTGRAGGAATPSAMAAYLGPRFVVRDRAGRPVRFTWRGARQTDEVIWIQLQGRSAAGLQGATVRNTLVFEVHRDQVNILKARYAGRERTLLFTRQSPSKRLP